MGAGSTYLRVVRSVKGLVSIALVEIISRRVREVCRTLLLVDLQLGVEVESSNDDVAGKVDGADDVEHKRIVKGNALGDLHHTQDDDQVGDLRRESHLDYWFEDTGEEGLG
jgi:hypothetical protein